MNIGVLSEVSRNAGGLFYSVRWLSKALLPKGCSITVYSPFDEFSDQDAPAWSPLKIQFYHNFGPLKSSFKLRRQLRRGKSDVLHVHGIWRDGQWAAFQHQRRAGIPVVVSPRGMLDPWAVNNSAWKKKVAGALFTNKALKSATCIHALCQSEAESIRAYGLKNPIAIIPNGVDLPAEVPRCSMKVGQRKKLLFLGRIHPKKGVSELISGWAGVCGKSQDACSMWQLLIAGWDDGGHLEGLKKLADERGLSWTEDETDLLADILFMGPRFGEEKDRLMRSVHAFILPSFSEGLPMAVLDAWSYALPVVMTEFCNIPEGFEAGAALSIKPNERSVAAGIEHLISMSDLEMLGIGQKGRALVEEKFTWDKIAQDMKEVYEWCLGGERPKCLMD
jgi:poly(glycerol-phosphate) alpha-glucosyltransferase